MKCLISFCLTILSISLFAQDRDRKLDTMSQHKGEMIVTKYIFYPAKEKEEGIEGTVYIGFTIEKDGTMDSIKIIKGSEAGLDSAALNAVSSMPKKWLPVPSRVQFIIPVKFSLK